MEPHDQMVRSYVQKARWLEGLTPLQSCSRRILQPKLYLFSGGDRGVTVIVVRNGHGDSSSNPGRG